MNKLKQQTLALASLLQTTALVDQLASTGTCDSKSNEASLKSLISNSTKVDEVFSSPKELSIGLSALTKAFGKKSKSMQNVIFYSLALINLEKKESAFLAAIFPLESSALFIKLIASADGIVDLEKDFKAFCSSMKRDNSNQ